jgi:diguanylate cyclase (GGDEF)-like protein
LVWPAFTAALLYTYFFIIRQDSRIDALTGIGNRFSFNEFVDRLTRQNAKETWSITMIDMDHFKEINDTLGHAMGDKALCDMANLILKNINHDDFAARYGGDEFVIATKTDPAILLNRLQNAIDEFNAESSRQYHIQMSFGCDTFVTGTDNVMQDFLGHVDSLMYVQKKYKNERRGQTSSSYNAGAT